MIRLFCTKLFGDTTVWTLPVLAFSLASGSTFMVTGGAMFFYTLEGQVDTNEATFYAVIASVALVLAGLVLGSLLYAELMPLVGLPVAPWAHPGCG